jgi:hypothetical protein
MAASLEEQFWANVDKNGPVLDSRIGECWIWNDSHYGGTGGGYGRLTYKGKRMYAHRMAVMLTGADIKGKKVCHRCDNPPCVRPDHLFAGSQAENMWDAVRKARTRGNAKLTELDVLQIREMRASGLVARQIAEHFGVTEWAIYPILRGENWRKLARANVGYEERRKTHCKRDHPRAEHGALNKAGRLICKACDRERSRRRRQEGLK